MQRSTFLRLMLTGLISAPSLVSAASRSTAPRKLVLIAGRPNWICIMNGAGAMSLRGLMACLIAFVATGSTRLVAAGNTGCSSIAEDQEVQEASSGAEAVPTTSPGLVLADGGQSNFAIVTPVHPGPEESTAAEWLATALRQVTGADFEIQPEGTPDLPPTCVYVGDTQAARDAGLQSDLLKPEEWYVRTTGQSLILTGGKPRGTIYAVTEFLETEIGVLMLDPFTEVVPSRPTVTLPSINRTGRPAFPVRAMFTGFPYGYPAQGGRLTEKFRVWNKNVIDGREAVGGHTRMIPTGVHSFGSFVSSKEFAASHPEYFGMDAEGRRLTDDQGTPSAWTQLCMTNADVRRITLERAKQLLLQDRNEAARESREPSRWLVLSQNDNTSNLCLCPDCKSLADREGSESGPLIEYVNHVARGLREEFPEVQVLTEAYNFTIQPPATIRPESNVVVRYCDNYGMSDLTHPLEHVRNDRMRTIFNSWRSTQCQLGVWDYWRVFQQHPPGFFTPSTNVGSIHNDLQFFQKSGVQLLTIEVEDLFGAGINSEPISADVQSFMPLRTWLGLKLADDPHKDLDALIDRFCEGYYGSAAEPMKSLLTLIEQRQQELPLRVVDVQRQVWAETCCDSTFFADAFRYLNDAFALTSDDPVRQVHVRRERLVVDSTFLWLEYHLREADAELSANFPSRAEVLRRHREDWMMYLATVFDEEGQRLAKPIIETGLSLAEKLKPEDTLFEHRPVAIAESDVILDGHMAEPFWQTAQASRLLPRDPAQQNDDPTSIRMAWTPDALYVGVEQPAERSSAILGVTLMTADRKGIQLSLYASRTNGPQTLSAYFYDYDATGGLRVVKDRKANSQSIGSITESKVTTEMRFLWSDIDVSITPNAEDSGSRKFVFNIEAYPLTDSKAPTYVSSPWLIGTAPTWHSGYYKSLQLKNTSSPHVVP